MTTDESKSPSYTLLGVILCQQNMAVRLARPFVFGNNFTLPALSVRFPSRSFRTGKRPSDTSVKMAAAVESGGETTTLNTRVIDSHLHIWASPKEAEVYPYFPGQEPTLPGDVDFLLKNMKEAGVEGALIVQPINHKFDHSLVTSVLKKYPSKFAGCCLANPSEDGSGIKQLENLVLEDGYCAVRFNPYLWPSGEKMTNAVGKALFSKAGDLGVPVGFMCMKGLDLHISEIEELCIEFPMTTVILDHVGFCKAPKVEEDNIVFAQLLKLSRFPQINIKFSALFRLSRTGFPYEDLSSLLSQIVSRFGAKRVMWGSDFPFVVPECGYKEAKEAVMIIAEQASLSPLELDCVLGETVRELFPQKWDAKKC